VNEPQGRTRKSVIAGESHPTESIEFRPVPQELSHAAEPGLSQQVLMDAMTVEQNPEAKTKPADIKEPPQTPGVILPDASAAESGPNIWNDSESWEVGAPGIQAQGAPESDDDGVFIDLELPDFSGDLFVIEPDQAGGPPAQCAAFAATPERPFTESRNVEKASPSQLFGSISPSGSGHEQADAGPALIPDPMDALEDRSIPARNSDRPLRTPRPPSSAAQPVPGLDGEWPGSFAIPSAPDKVATRSYKGTAIGALLLLIIAAGVAALGLSPEHPISKNARTLMTALGVKLATLPPATGPPPLVQLPLFIPQIPPDPGYAAGHPGWERYQADALEYLVYRENGVIRAIQVLAQEPGAITPPFFKTCIRLTAGHEQYALKIAEERDGISIVTGGFGNGGEVVTYRRISGGEILGFVLSFPENQTGSAGDAGAAPG